MRIEWEAEEAGEEIWPPGLGGPSRFLRSSTEQAAYSGIGTATEMVPSRESRLGYENWGKSLRDVTDRNLLAHIWFAECVANGFRSLGRTVDIDPELRGGMPVLRGTGFTVSQVLAELSQTDAAEAVADEFDLDVTVVREMLEGLALVFQQRWKR